MGAFQPRYLSRTKRSIHVCEMFRMWEESTLFFEEWTYKPIEAFNQVSPHVTP